MNIFKDGLNLDIGGMLSTIIPVAFQIGLLILAFIIFVPIGRKIIEKTIQKAEKNEKQSPILRVVRQTENGLQFACERDMRKRIRMAFDEARIEIPHPYQINIEKHLDH